jgi:hypothetical protein
MPPRWLCCVIVLFWLATTGWLFWHDLRPLFLPSEPPMFHVDLVEEVHKSGNPLKTNWSVERQDKQQPKPAPVFRASTWVDHKDQDTYTLHAELDASKDPSYQPVFVGKYFKIKKMSSAYRVTRSGQLRSLLATVTVHLEWSSSPLLQFFESKSDLFQKDPSYESLKLEISGEVREGQFFAHCSVGPELPNTHPIMQFDLPPATVSSTGSVLMPLHPVDRIRGLRLGQSWRQPLVDPLRDALPHVSGGMRWLHARVRPQPEVLKLNGGETRCLVIEYTNDEDETVARTWVEEDGERVLQQEAILEDIHWIMKRESMRRSGMGLLGS